MKNLKEMGLVALTEKENINNNGGSVIDYPFIVCCVNIPPMDLEQQLNGIIQ